MMYEDVLINPNKFSFVVQSLGRCHFESPVQGRTFVDDTENISFASQVKNINALQLAGGNFPAFQKAGPRKKIFFDPTKTKAGIVTCGGLCPGLNNVIKGIVTVLSNEYGVESCMGFRYGFNGMPHYAPFELTVERVDSIHKTGGTILGTSRGMDVELVADTLQQQKIDILFCVGGDGTARGANDLITLLAKRGYPLSIICIPKTIDNDLRFIEKTFGFETAVQIASDVITSAHNEAESACNGVALVKLMGRDSGFIAAASTLASTCVDFCLVPEVPFSLEGLCTAIKKRLQETCHAVVVVAEGAGQSLFDGRAPGRDASGNALKNDIGLLLKEQFQLFFRAEGQDIVIKYLDPSYYIRSVAANSSDAIYCYLLSENAVHAAFAGKTGIMIGQWNNYFTHVPLQLIIQQRNTINLESALWKGVTSVTKQNNLITRF